MRLQRRDPGRLLDEGIALPYCVGVSAGAGNLASYLAGQRGRNLRFFTEHIHNPRYFGLRSFLRTGDLFGLQFIYGELTRAAGKDPLDFAAMQRNPAQYEAVVTNARTGEAVYFGREHMRQDDYRLIMASSALPAAQSRRLSRKRMVSSRARRNAGGISEFP